MFFHLQLYVIKRKYSSQTNQNLFTELLRRSENNFINFRVLFNKSFRYYVLIFSQIQNLNMNSNSYLNRLGITEAKRPTLSFLTELQNKHLLSIPFEDLDIPDRARIELNLRKIYNKIIPTKRGGFCYELNGLFHWLLTKLGYKVDMLSARVYNQQTNELGPEFDHMALLVHLKKGLLDKDFLVDVGFGDSFRIPIEMPSAINNYDNMVAEDISGSYRIIKNHEDVI